MMTLELTCWSCQSTPTNSRNPSRVFTIWFCVCTQTIAFML